MGSHFVPQQGLTISILSLVPVSLWPYELGIILMFKSIKRKHKNVLLIFSKCSVRRSNSNSCAYFQLLININKLIILVQLNVVCRVVREQGGWDVFFSCDNNLLGHPFSGHLRRAVLTHFLATFL